MSSSLMQIIILCDMWIIYLEEILYAKHNAKYFYLYIAAVIFAIESDDIEVNDIVISEWLENEARYFISETAIKSC